MKSRPFADAKVAAVFASYPGNLRNELLFLRELIFETAIDTKQVGELLETLKWGQPSYLNARPKVGTTIRIDAVRSTPGEYAMYFHCQTRLVSTFRKDYPDDFRFEGNRAILFDEHATVPEAALRECVALALTYHLNK
ncbi:MAG: DUF1801 domain-containing protein [Gammaproteobacteria bacterium]